MMFYALLTGIVIQVVMVCSRVMSTDGQARPQDPIALGDTLRFLTSHSENDSPDTIPIATETALATILYVFHPDCVYCAASASTWASHFARSATASHLHIRRFALTLADPAAAQSFAQAFGWQVDVRSVAGLNPTSREYSLLSRTPWVFVFDSHGVLRMEARSLSCWLIHLV